MFLLKCFSYWCSHCRRYFQTLVIFKLESGTVFIHNGVSVSVTNLPFLLQRNQLTSLASHQKWLANQALQPPGKGYMFREMCLWLRQILGHQWLALQVPDHPGLSQVMAVDLHQVKGWEEGEVDHHHEDKALRNRHTFHSRTTYGSKLNCNTITVRRCCCCKCFFCVKCICMLFKKVQ